MIYVEFMHDKQNKKNYTWSLNYVKEQPSLFQNLKTEEIRLGSKVINV